MIGRTPEAQEWRRLYSLGAWRGPSGLRLAQLRHEPFCRFCELTGRVTEATVVDHVVPHRGDPDLFFDRTNLQSLCKPCHDWAKAEIERHGYHGICDASGWPIDARHPANAR